MEEFLYCPRCLNYLNYNEIRWCSKCLTEYCVYCECECDEHYCENCGNYIKDNSLWGLCKDCDEYINKHR